MQSHRGRESKQRSEVIPITVLEATTTRNPYRRKTTTAVIRNEQSDGAHIPDRGQVLSSIAEERQEKIIGKNG